MPVRDIRYPGPRFRCIDGAGSIVHRQSVVRDQLTNERCLRVPAG